MIDSAEGRAALVLVGTPLGNREDLSPRARRTIESADLLLCEDTRSPLRLMGEDARLPPRTSCFVGNEIGRVEAMLTALAEGKRVVFVSEAGMPVWSDPGVHLVRGAVAAGYPVEVIPGPTAASMVLAASGFDAPGALFLGFVARSGPERAAALARVASSSGPTLLYEAGNRTPALLRDLSASLPDADTRAVVIGRELTKRHEEWIRGTARELAQRVREPLRGEVSIAVAGAPIEQVEDPARAAARAVLELMLATDLKPRARARALAELTGDSATELYARLLGSS